MSNEDKNHRKSARRQGLLPSRRTKDDPEVLNELKNYGLEDERLGNRRSGADRRDEVE